MKNKDIKILVEGWRKFLNESLNISKQIERAKALIDEISVQEPSKNKFKLHIEINKTDVCE